MKQKIEAVTDDGLWYRTLARTYNADIIHWESEGRAALRESFAGDVDILFDSEEGFEVEPLSPSTRESEIGYLERRIARLRQIQEGL